MDRAQRCLVERRAEIGAIRERERQAWARVTDVEAFARETRERVDLTQEVGSREMLARLMGETTMQTLQEEQRVTDVRVGVIEAGLAEAQRVVVELREAIEAAEVEFARTDCGSSSRSSTGLDAGVEANTPFVMGGNGDRHEGASSSGEQGTQDFGAGGMDPSLVDEMEDDMFVAMDGGGFRLANRGPM